jgi:hypothetical protein
MGKAEETRTLHPTFEFPSPGNPEIFLSGNGLGIAELSCSAACCLRCVQEPFMPQTIFGHPTKRVVIALASFAVVIAIGGVILQLTDKSLRMPLMVHSKFFSIEAKLPKVLDPHVFIAQADAPAAIGAQGIAHLAGFRTAYSDDPDNSALFTAQGKPLGFNLGTWFAASGTVLLEPFSDGRERITVDMANLLPGGTYDFFENHFDERPVGFTPLDGTATTNGFVAGADGRAHITLIAPKVLTHDNAVLLIYHSDGKTNGASRGGIGVTAHHQLVARIPEP